MEMALTQKRNCQGLDGLWDLGRQLLQGRPRIAITLLTQAAPHRRPLRKAEKGAMSSQSPLCPTRATSDWSTHPSKHPSA